MSNRPRRSHLAPLALFFSLALGVAGASVARAGGNAPDGTVGPDVTVFSLHELSNYGGAGGFHGYSLGTVSCNIGDQPVNWCDNNGGCGSLTWEQHPVIGQNVWRLKDGRFEQIGGSWLKHGFLSLNTPSGTACTGPGGQQCTSPPLGGNQLGIGCTDAYGSGLNGGRPLGMPSEVNATTGVFPFPETAVGFSAVYDQRIKIADADLDPALNVGALYFGEGHYVVDNDAEADNAFNNASYRVLTVSAGSLNLNLSGSTIREKWAFDAWQTQDPSVETIRLSFTSGAGSPMEGFNVARKVTDLGGGNWHYEYLVHNMNSDRAAGSFAVDFVDGTTVTNMGFHDFDHHSGEYEPVSMNPYSTTDWPGNFDSPSGVVSWATDDFAVAPEANAIRWSTGYNFWFDADAAPDQIEAHTIGLFKPGNPSELVFWEAPTTPDLFLDGFETGDTSRWSLTVQ